MNQDQQQNNIGTLMSILGLYSQEEQAGLEAELARQQLANDEAWKQKQYELDLRQVDYATGKPYYKSSSGGSGGSSSSSKPTQNDYLSAFMSAINSYKKPSDYRADLVRYKPQIIAYIGTSNWDYLYEDADKRVMAGNQVNPNYSSQSSPLRAMLE